MKTLNSSTISKINTHNIRNALSCRTQFSFPKDCFVRSLCCSKNGGSFVLALSFSSKRKMVFSKLQTSQDKSNVKGKKKSLQAPTTTKIEAPEPGGAPAVSGESGGDSVPPPLPPGSKKVGSWKLKGLPKRVLALLSNLPLALAEMFAVAALMALGTFIDQGEAPDFYFQKYPEDNPIMGFFTWRWILTLGFDHMFSSPLFLGTLSLLGASLMACTYTTQIPIVKVARRWSFLHSAEAIRKQEYSDTLPRASIQDLGVILMGAGYEVSQFHSDLSLFDLNGKEIMRKTISVNDPLRYGGITIYQTDWSLSALQIMKDDEGPFNLAMAPLKINGDKKLYGTFLPVGDADSTNLKGISMLARDMQSVVLYDQEGKFAGVRRPNSKLPIDIDGMRIVVLDAIGSTGLDIKTDPGVPIVYAGFGALMLTTCISFLSHTQIWALQDGTSVVVGGKTNRAKGEFPDDMNFLLDQVPEIVDSSASMQLDSSSS
ncbi:cytochrome c biogenesis protein CCS1, chloroplastic isoform X2 [Sesamum indicum]|uniref:Cytochrome c biogenesis protein CCS1, chloroplastic isoform X2 n=1 Tax=Sesamum indicum TaxID=4182 RepID=A0A6I9TRM0_SESIN|nr:cytochrome c biogenesis protein CCS1, chloroplastic isoform X2 [Sesamum indicum]